MTNKCSIISQITTLFLHVSTDGFGGLVVRMLALFPEFAGSNPAKAVWIFLYVNILSMPSFGGEVK
jgi:hypothetical protein